MRNRIRLTESELTRLIKRVISEQGDEKSVDVPNCEPYLINNFKSRVDQLGRSNVTIQTGPAYGAPCKDCLIITTPAVKCACKIKDIFG